MKRFTDKRKKPERMFSDLIKRQTDRQTDKQTEKQIDTYNMINRETDRIYKQIDKR